MIAAILVALLLVQVAPMSPKVRVYPPANSGSVLIPGSGWTGPTTEPGASGSGDFSTAKAIARWDVVPFQSFRQWLPIGVIAFHGAGINRVEMAVDGGAWKSFTSMQVNSETGVLEYIGLLFAQHFSITKQIEVRAIVYPNVGAPRLLESLFLTADVDAVYPRTPKYVSLAGNDFTGDGSLLNPYATIGKAARATHEQYGTADGGQAYLMAGDYAWRQNFQNPTCEQVWFTVKPAPGVAKADVRITSQLSGGLEMGLNKVEGLTLKALLIGSSGIDDKLWIDDCDAVAEGDSTNPIGSPGVGWTLQYNKKYWTDCTVRNCVAGPYYAEIHRNVVCTNIGEDVFRDPVLLVNCSIDTVTFIPGLHPDILEGSATDADNRIIYGFKATNVRAQGIYHDAGGQTGIDITNAAYVNLLIQKGTSDAFLSQLLDMNINHLLLWNCTWVDQTVAWRSNVLSNLSVRACCFSQMVAQPGRFTTAPTSGQLLAAGVWDQNHYQVSGGLELGTNVTTGSAGFVSGSDFHPGVGSALKARQSPLLVPIDLAGATRTAPTSVGAYE